MGIGFRVSIEARLARYNMDATRALYLAKAGLVKSIYRLSKSPSANDSIYECGTAFSAEENSDPEMIRAIFSGSLGDGYFKVAYRLGAYLYPGMSDEERRININTAPQLVLENLLQYVGEDPAIAADIIQWRNPDPGLDDGYYEALPSPYKCKHEKFSAPEELLLVKGFDRKIFNKVKDYITVFGDPAKLAVNINTAPKAVLSILMLAGTSVNAPIDKVAADIFADRIVVFRNGPDGENGTKDDNIFTADINIEAIVPELSTQAAELKKSFTTVSRYFRIESAGVTSRTKTEKRVVCVVQKEQGKASALKAYREY
jgi:hypothetical protein